MTKPKIIFFGNGLLADTALKVLNNTCEIVFHARTKEDLEEVKKLKSADKEGELHGVLASFGVIIKQDVLDLFEPEGILNIHPSMLPDLRGPSPIESAILRGDSKFGVSVMKLASAMDAGPIYFQQIINLPLVNPYFASPLEKSNIYDSTAVAGAEWIAEHLSENNLPTPTEQDESQATFCQKLDKSMSIINPEKETSAEILRKIIALSGWPKTKYEFLGHECIIHAAHLGDGPELDQDLPEYEELSLKCKDGKTVYIDSLQPAGKKTMDAKSFLNGYRR